MKPQQQLARELFFQQGMSKTAIAEKLGISRRTIYQWSVDGDWETLRRHASIMPLMLTERVYYIIDQVTTQMLSLVDGIIPTITAAQVNILTKLTNIICKLRKGSTVNEDMETFQLFLERLAHEEESLAEEVTPHIEKFIAERCRRGKDEMIRSGHTPNGGIDPARPNPARREAEREEMVPAPVRPAPQTPQAQPVKPSAQPASAAAAVGSKRELPQVPPRPVHMPHPMAPKVQPAATAVHPGPSKPVTGTA